MRVDDIQFLHILNNVYFPSILEASFGKQDADLNTEPLGNLLNSLLSVGRGLSGYSVYNLGPSCPVDYGKSYWLFLL
jgi:hypothetical protein